MARGRNEDTRVRVDARLVVAALFLAGAALVLSSTPARSATQNVEVGNFYFGAQGVQEITATVGDRLRFEVVTGTSHTIEITELGVSSGDLDKDDPPFSVTLTQAGTFRIWCDNHQAQGHEVNLVVSPAPTTTTTSTTSTTTTTSSTTTTTTTTLPGSSTTTTVTSTTVPGATTTTLPEATTTTVGGSPSTTASPESSTTSTAAAAATGGGTATSTTTAVSDEGPGGAGDVDQALGVDSPRIDDAAWVRPLWWTVLTGSLAGLVWVAVSWRRRPTEFD